MVLHTFNRTLLEPPSGPYEEQTIHGMLEHWAAATPAAPAVEFEVGLQTHAALWRLRGPQAWAQRRPQALLQCKKQTWQTSFHNCNTHIDRAHQQVCWGIQVGLNPVLQVMLRHLPFEYQVMG